MTMTLADQAGLAASGSVSGGLQDQAGEAAVDVGSGPPGRPVRRRFSGAYKARILAAYDELAEGSSERGALLRSERLYHSHIEHWRAQRDNGRLAVSSGEPSRSAGGSELGRLRAENKKLKARNERLAERLGKTQTALEIAGKAFALLEEVSSSATAKLG